MSNSYKKLHTLEAANAGVRMVVKDAAGRDTENWIQVRGGDSEAFQRASQNMRRKMLSFLEEHGAKGKDSDAYVDMMLDQARAMRVSLVTAWSFDEDCTLENVNELFKCAPYIAEQVDAHSSKRELFVKA